MSYVEVVVPVHTWYVTSSGTGMYKKVYSRARSTAKAAPRSSAPHDRARQGTGLTHEGFWIATFPRNGGCHILEKWYGTLELRPVKGLDIL